jgi:hypothetical protein
MAGIFNSTIFNATIFNTGAAVSAPPATPSTGGGGGGGGMWPAHGKKRRYLDKELTDLVAEVAAELRDEGVAVLPVMATDIPAVQEPPFDWTVLEKEQAVLADLARIKHDLKAAAHARAEQEEEEELLLLQLV